jgi:hypothetical protein
MILDCIIAPPTAPQTAVAQPPPPRQPKLDRLDLELLNAIGENGKYGLPIWSLLNWVAGDQNPKDRDEARILRLELWRRLRTLLHTGIVFRFARRNVTLTKLPSVARKRGRRTRKPSVRRDGNIDAGSTIGLLSDQKTDGRQQPLHVEPVHVKPPPTEPVVKHEKTKSDLNPAEIAAAARALARLPRKKIKRRWTGWLRDSHMWRGAQVRLPDGRVGSVYGILRGQVVILKDPVTDQFPPFDVYPAAQVQRYKHPHAVALGKLKKGIKERRSIKKLFACWRNGCQPVKPGSRARGRPPR